MALNLICSYDSDEDSDSPPKEPLGSTDAEPSPPTEKGKSFFFGGEEGSSTDDELDDQLKRSKHPEKKPATGTTRRLPSAGSVLKGSHVVGIHFSFIPVAKHNGSSVFSSEREQEDLAQQLTLSQHVPLTEKVEARKKPVCRYALEATCTRYVIRVGCSCNGAAGVGASRAVGQTADSSSIRLLRGVL
ncbi:hypothetical protein Y032_0188g1136 [Ancylostoma ceylanicum]|uniref:Uncharacterized protein n=1 Tax=Ancylostoma ceylanicum TaxID=53326 RepID=A0A016SRB8_9BILA|nr:hypothetical protein Y032_0188g1136 [Ancylostoma ceylanicum]